MQSLPVEVARIILEYHEQHEPLLSCERYKWITEMSLLSANFRSAIKEHFLPTHVYAWIPPYNYTYLYDGFSPRTDGRKIMGCALGGTVVSALQEASWKLANVTDLALSSYHDVQQALVQTSLLLVPELLPNLETAFLYVYDQQSNAILFLP